MLNRDDEPLKKIWTVRIPKYAIILLIVSIFYYVTDKKKAMLQLWDF